MSLEKTNIASKLKKN